MSVYTDTTVVTAASSHDLTSLSVAHDELNIPVGDTSKDTFLSRAITESSAAIVNYCNRVFAVEAIQDLIYIQDGHLSVLQLSRWPVVNVATPSTNADAPIGSVLLAFAAAPAFVVPGVSVAGLNIQAGTTVQGIAGGSVTLSLPTLGDVPPGTPITFGFSLIQETATGIFQALIPGTDFQLDAVNGQVLRLNAITGRQLLWERLPATVSYSAGFVTVPPDVEQACLRMVTERYWRRGVDPSLKEMDQPNLGRRVWWVGGPPKTGGLPEEIIGTLDNYRVPFAV